MKLFGTSGIRGVYGKGITEQLAKAVGMAAGSVNDAVSVAMDTRVSGPALRKALVSGMVSQNCSVTDFDIVPTPLLAFGVKKLKKQLGIMITASHNPPEYNGFKLWDKDGKAITKEEEAKYEKIIAEKKFMEKKVIDNVLERYNIAKDYEEEILNRFSLKGNLKVLIDPANGAAFKVSPDLLKKFDYETIAINNTADGKFPNRNPEPIEKNLQGTMKIAKEKKVDVSFCQDGDADRQMPLDDKGNLVDFDKFLAWFSKKMLESCKSNKIVTTVDASMLVENYLPDAKIIRVKVGDVYVANECKKINACFGGEPSGSYVFPEFGLWPDGVYSMLKTLQFLEDEKRKLSEILQEIPHFPMQRMKIQCENNKKENVMKNLKSLVPEDAELNEVDGLLMTFGDSKILIRPSGTEPYIRLNVEAEDSEKLKSLLNKWQNKIKEEIKNA